MVQMIGKNGFRLGKTQETNNQFYANNLNTIRIKVIYHYTATIILLLRLAWQSFDSQFFCVTIG